MSNFEDLIWLFTSDIQSRGIVRLNIAEGALLYKYCKKKKDGSLLEIGRKHGGSTVIMASALEKGTMTSIDIVLHEQAIENIKPYKDKVRLITYDSKYAEWDTDIDLLFIDGDHSFVGVKHDVERFTPFINSSGYVVFHDVIGMKPELRPIISKLLNNGWKRRDEADSMLVLQK